jgi:hypothetical protein
MQTVDEQPETIHLYVVREEEPKPPVFPIVLSALSLIVLLVFSALVPYQQPVTRLIIRVPAVLLPLKTFTATAAINPTGRKTYPATTAHGVLTITNGSVISQTLPAGFRLGNFATDTAVFVPAGSADGYGVAAVSAHALITGSSGNILAYSINQVEGSSVYIRNLSAFHGGRDSYSVKVVTAQDRQRAVQKTRSVLAQVSIGLHYPCNDALNNGKQTINESWRCQFVTYRLPEFYHVTGIKLVGKNLILSAWFVERPVYRSFK